ncbi:MAG: ABC transporter permease subunit [Paracoccaceae bacterium]
MLGPVAAGLAGAVGPAFGWAPELGAAGFSLEAWRTLFAWPGLARAAGLSLGVGVLATVVSLGLTLLICAGWQGTRVWRWVERGLSPILAMPHAAAAFGLAFLIAPSGWAVRAASPWLTGWETPPDVLVVQDPLGLALVAGLVAKEVPFLLLMTLAASVQAEAGRTLLVARALGQGRVSGWLKAVLPRIWPQIRLPVYAVLAYSMSVVDVAAILGPNAPPTLAVRIVGWMNDPDLAWRSVASAGALLQLGLVAGALAAWRAGEVGVGRLGRRWAEGGARWPAAAEGAARGAGLLAATATAAAAGFGLAGLAVWSCAGLWTFPEALPDGWTLRSWARHGPAMAGPALATLGIALAATVAALGLAAACLETEFRRGRRPGAGALWLLYLPLIVPQVAFLPGLQRLALAAGLEGGWASVAAAHLVFVLPYVFLSLGDPWRAWDRRWATAGGAVGASGWGVLWRVRAPMMLAPLLTAFAVGFAVSVGQYLPTLLIGGGRVPTLTTEAVALASGGDRRAIGVWALAQAGAAALPFLLAAVGPRLIWRNRRALRG